MSDDADLHTRFRRQRNEDHQRASDFNAVVERGRRRAAAARVGVRPRWALAALALLTVGTLATLRRRERTIEQAEARNLANELTAKVWRAPTDFLLDLPASDLTRTVPTFLVPAPIDDKLRDINPRDTNAVRTRRTES